MASVSVPTNWSGWARLPVLTMELLALKNVQKDMKISRCIGVSFLLCSLAVCAAADVQKEARQMTDLLGVRSGDRVADLGAGDGEWSVALAEIVGTQGKVFATEVDQGKLDKITRLVQRRNLDNITTVLGTQESTGLQPGSVDAVLIRLVYHHFVHPEKMLAELKQALRPGGRIAIVDFGPENNFPRSSVPGFRDGHGVVAETIIEEMAAAGFRLDERRDRWADNNQRYLLVFSLETNESRGLQDSSDSRGKTLPVLGLLPELLLSLGREAIVFCPAVVVGHAPLSLNPILLLEAVERRIERSLIDLKHILRNMLDTLRDTPAVHRTESQGLQNQEIQGPLQQITLGFLHSPSNCSQDTVIPVDIQGKPWAPVSA